MIDAALEALRTRGFAGASSRAIGELGGFNPALIFYYFGSLHGLFLAALESASEARMERYRPAAEEVASAEDLIRLLSRIYEEDVESGFIRVASELVAAGVSHPEIGTRVVALMEPWIELAEGAVERALAGSPLAPFASPRELALAGVTFYLGANLLTQLVPESEAVEELLSAAERGAELLKSLDD